MEATTQATIANTTSQISPEDQQALLNIFQTQCLHRGRHCEKILEFLLNKPASERQAVVEFILLFSTIPYNDNLPQDREYSRFLDNASQSKIRSASEIVSGLAKEGVIGCNMFQGQTRPGAAQTAAAFLDQLELVLSVAGELGALFFCELILAQDHGYLPWGNIEALTPLEVDYEQFYRSDLYGKIAPYLASKNFDLEVLLRAMIRSGLAEETEEMQLAALTTAFATANPIAELRVVDLMVSSNQNRANRDSGKDKEE